MAFDTYINTIGTATGQFSGGNLVLPMPIGVKKDDLLVMLVIQGNDQVVSTLPGGWTIVDASNIAGSPNSRGFWAWKFCDEDEGSTVTVTLTAGSHLFGVIFSVAGVTRDSSNPYSTKSVQVNDVASTNLTGSTITPAAGELVLFMAAQEAEFTSSTPPGLSDPTFSEKIDRTFQFGNCTLCVSSGYSETGAATGSRTATSADAASSAVYIVALRNKVTTYSEKPWRIK